MLSFDLHGVTCRALCGRTLGLQAKSILQHGLVFVQKVLQSVPKNNHGCKVFYFSDGAPKDAHQIVSVFQLLLDKGGDYGIDYIYRDTGNLDVSPLGTQCSNKTAILCRM